MISILFIGHSNISEKPIKPMILWSGQALNYTTIPPFLKEP
jgi:hypothetical protein